MPGFGYGYNAPYGFLSPYAGASAQQLPRYEVIHVNGRGGVDAFQMGPNSSVILMDDTAPMIWLCRTDGAGYKTATAFDISVHQDAPAVDLSDINQRLSRLEEWVNGKSDAGISKRKRSSDAADSGEQSGN